MNRYKKLLGNSFIFAVGNLGSKLMQFIMVPLYSYTLSTSEFGRVDVLTTIVNLLAPIICFDIFDAVFRFALDKKDNKKETFSTGFFLIALVSIIALIIGYLVSSLGYLKNYPIILATYLLIVTMFFSLFSNYARAINKIKQFATAGIIDTLVMGILNIVLLIYFKMGINGYMLSMILGLAVAAAFLFLDCHLYSEISLENISLNKFKKLTVYSLPLIPNVLAWWFNSSSDRIFILMFLGASMNGIYAMASKIPNMLSTLISIFFQSWQISAVEEFNSKDSKYFISNVFQAFIEFLFLISVVMLAFLKPIFVLLLSKSYYVSWTVVPLLLLALIYTSLASFLGTIYTATKKTMPIMVTTIYGAIINVAASLLFIKAIGINGAALANVISFLAVSLLRLKDIRNMNKIKVNYLNVLFLHIIFLVVAVSNYLFNDVIVAMIGIACVLILVVKSNNISLLLSRVKIFK